MVRALGSRFKKSRIRVSVVIWLYHRFYLSTTDMGANKARGVKAQRLPRNIHLGVGSTIRHLCGIKMSLGAAFVERDYL